MGGNALCSGIGDVDGTYRKTERGNEMIFVVYVNSVAYPGILFGGGGSTNSVEDRGQRERGSGGVAPCSGVLEAAVIWYKKFHFI